ncbi:hypothetical protein IWQ61_010238, partial [Dispira simplex]
MKISILAFAPLGLVALLVTVSAGPTDPTVNTSSGPINPTADAGPTMDTGAIDEDIRTQMTLGQVYWMIENFVDRVRSIFDKTTTKEVTVTRVDEMFKIAGDYVKSVEKIRVRDLDETNPAKNGIRFSKLLDGCISKSNVKVWEIRIKLVAGFHNKPIPRNLFKGGLTWAYSQSILQILIDDYTTIKGYFIRKYSQ